MRARAARAARIATTALAGALVVAITAPRAAADESAALTSSSDSFQPALDRLLEAMQQAVAYDSALPFATPAGDATLMTTVQDTNYELLMAGLSRATELFNGWFFQSPEVVAGDAANPRQYFDFFTPDIYYYVTAGLASGATYELTGTVGGGTEGLSISSEAIMAGTVQTQSSLQLGDNLAVNPNGTFTVDIGPTEPSGAVNYIDDHNATAEGDASLLIRDMLGNWAKGPASLSIHCVANCPAFFAIPSTGLLPGVGTPTAAIDSLATGLAGSKIDSVDSLLTTLFNAFAAFTGSFNQASIATGETAGIELPVNTMSPLAPETGFGAGLESAAVSAGNFDLPAGEALIVKVPDVTSGYSGIELMNVFGAALPYTLAQTTLNNTTAFHDPDGYTYYVVSATNPGVANWLDSSGVTHGEIFARFENIPAGTNATDLPVTTEVVPVAQVGSHLPADTPTVSPAEYTAEMSQRVFSYDYALDASRANAQPDWVIQELLLYALQALMGSSNFDAVFGSEPVTALALRLTPALTPDFDTVAHDLVTNPFGSLSAIVDNLPLAWSDVSLPVELAMAETVVAPLLPGFQLSSLLDDVLVDPNTSITAGLLNARDDLATAVLSANSDFPSQLGSLATLEWANMSELVQVTPSAELADLVALLNPVDLFGA
jgi:hypothetical protein